jgi:hypothetical protein
MVIGDVIFFNIRWKAGVDEAFQAATTILTSYVRP